jgi:hypothetical protein
MPRLQTLLSIIGLLKDETTPIRRIKYPFVSIFKNFTRSEAHTFMGTMNVYRCQKERYPYEQY